MRAEVRMRSLVALAFGAIALGAMVGCSSAGDGPPSGENSPSSLASEPESTPTSFTANGTISVPMDPGATAARQGVYNIVLDGVCVPRVGFSDVHDGAQVVILDPSGTKIAVGALQTGAVVEGATDSVESGRCEYKFQVSDVPTGLSLYSVHIGNTFRGEQTYTLHDLYRGVVLAAG